MSGGAHTSRTIMLPELRRLFDACPEDASREDYRSAVITENVLGKKSLTARERTFRYLRELYSLDIHDGSFSVLRRIWRTDSAAHPLLALLSALSRDAVLRATVEPILSTRPGDGVTSEDLRAAVQRSFKSEYSDATAAKIGRNALSSWTQSGHFKAVKRTTRMRTLPASRPAAVAYALFLAHQTGSAGQALFDSLYCKVLDVPPALLRDQAFEAAQRGWIDYREAGGIIEVGFRGLVKGAA